MYSLDFEHYYISTKNMSEVIVLYEGYSILNDHYEMKANCSCILIKGINNIIVDTMTPWDANKILTALTKHNVNVEDINFVISTHGHSDHVGNNNLFLKAKHIVGFSISFEDKYFIHPFDEGKEYIVNEQVKVIPTPGHTLSDVTVLVTALDRKITALAGDLFEKFEDINNPSIWIEAGSQDPAKQRMNRSKVAELADWIVPGHGPMFKVTDTIRETLRAQIHESTF